MKKKLTRVIRCVRRTKKTKKKVAKRSKVPHHPVDHAWHRAASGRA